ncbi:hypothetical protein ACYSNR_00505 [Enterococcus sp. LJL128]|uniref:hypothetical protein n=1 Tax=Enterococcus sp. LJL51 TaxID=3416656 RepID=UPI003CEAF4D9
MTKVIKGATVEYKGISKGSTATMHKPFGSSDRQNIQGMLYGGKRPAQNFGFSRPSTGHNRQDILSSINKRPAQTLDLKRPLYQSNQTGSGTQNGLNPLIYKGNVKENSFSYIKKGSASTNGAKTLEAKYVRQEPINQGIADRMYRPGGQTFESKQTWQTLEAHNVTEGAGQNVKTDKMQRPTGQTFEADTFDRPGGQAVPTDKMTRPGSSGQTLEANPIYRPGGQASGSASGSASGLRPVNQGSGGYTSQSSGGYQNYPSGGSYQSIPYYGSMPQPVWTSAHANPVAREAAAGAVAAGGAAAAAVAAGIAGTKGGLNKIVGAVAGALGGAGMVKFDIEGMLDIVDGLEEILTEFTETIVPAAEKVAQSNFYINGKAKDACKTLEQVTGKTEEIIGHYYRASGLVTKTIEKAVETDEGLAQAIMNRYGQG